MEIDQHVDLERTTLHGRSTERAARIDRDDLGLGDAGQPRMESLGLVRGVEVDAREAAAHDLADHGLAGRAKHIDKHLVGQFDEQLLVRCVELVVEERPVAAQSREGSPQVRQTVEISLSGQRLR